MDFNKKAKTPQKLMMHCQRRFEERYQESLAEYQLKDWNKAIQRNGKSVRYLGKESNTREYYVVEEKFYAVYNKKLHTICTFLTPKMMDNSLKQIGLSLEILTDPSGLIL